MLEPKSVISEGSSILRENQPEASVTVNDKGSDVGEIYQVAISTYGEERTGCDSRALSEKKSRDQESDEARVSEEEGGRVDANLAIEDRD